MWSSDDDDIVVSTKKFPKGRKVIQSSDDSSISDDNLIGRRGTSPNDDRNVMDKQSNSKAKIAAKKFHKTIYDSSDDDDSDDSSISDDNLIDHRGTSPNDNRNVMDKQSRSSKNEIASKKIHKTIYDSSDDDDSDLSFENKLKSLQISGSPQESKPRNFSRKDDDKAHSLGEESDSESESTYYSVASYLKKGSRNSIKQPNKSIDALDVDSDSDSILSNLSDESGISNKSSLKKIKSSSISNQKNGKWTLDSTKNEYSLYNSKSNEGLSKVKIPLAIFDTLFDYQVEGVEFLAKLHEQHVGGILGDDMGMGKTFMTVCFLGGLIRTRTIRNALIIAPLSVLRSWEKEAKKVVSKCSPYSKIQILNSDLNMSRRIRMIRDAIRCTNKQPHIVITTYSMVREMTLDFIDHDRSFWDYVVLDEGHTIKNHNSKQSISCRRICINPKTHRLMLSGTPIMNNLKELWSVFDWATSGKVLGTVKNYNEYFGKTIEAARNKNASPLLIREGDRANKELQNLLKPYFLQRMKAEYLKDKLSTKTEIVLWTHLSSQQRSMYLNFVNSGDSIVKMILRGEKTSPLEAITWLKKLCGHPLIAEKQEDGERPEKVQDAVSMLAASAKLQILVSLMGKLIRDGHKTLIFSQSTRMLDIIQKVLKASCQINLGRIDGTTKERDRQMLVDSFNNEKSTIHAMLLSTKAAGIGLTLTGADRVVVYDPSWTPAEDSQAVDRCFRIGQMKPVVVFRMIAAGTVEEKMYERQIFKDGIRRTVFTEGKSVQRYFDSHELRKLFQLAEPGVCEVMDKVHDIKTDWSEFSSILQHKGVVGLSRHDGFYNPAEIQESELPDLDDQQPLTTGKSQRVLNPISNNPIALGLSNVSTKHNEEVADTYEKFQAKGKVSKIFTNGIVPDGNLKPVKADSIPTETIMVDDSDDIEMDELLGNTGTSSIRNKPGIPKGSSIRNEENQENLATISNKKFSRKKISDDLQLASHLKPRASLKVLLNLLECAGDDMDKDQYQELHHKIAFVSHSLNLLGGSQELD